MQTFVLMAFKHTHARERAHTYPSLDYLTNTGMWFWDSGVGIELSPVELSLGAIFAPDKPEDRHLSTEAKERQQLNQIVAMLKKLDEKVQEEERGRSTARDTMEAAVAAIEVLKAKIQSEKRARALAKQQAAEEALQAKRDGQMVCVCVCVCV
eukprot:COSAG03_NODE_2441_length_2761_cov_4.199850_1_plen_152_part_10